MKKFAMILLGAVAVAAACDVRTAGGNPSNVSLLPVPEGAHFTAVSAGNGFACALKPGRKMGTKSEIICWRVTP